MERVSYSNTFPIGSENLEILTKSNPKATEFPKKCSTKVTIFQFFFCLNFFDFLGLFTAENPIS